MILLIPVFTLTPWHGYPQGFAESVELAKQQDKQLMVYNFAGQNQPLQAAWRFALGFFFDSLGAGCDGQFLCAYDIIQGNPYDLLDSWIRDRMAFWPPIPEQNEVGGPSINYESMREGIDDMRYIAALKKLIGRARSEGLTVEADTAQKVLEAIVGSLDFSTFFRRADIWPELQPSGGSHWQRLSPFFDPVAAAAAGEKFPTPISYFDGTLQFPCGWSNKDFDNARWGIAQEIIKLQNAMSNRNKQK